MLTYCEAFTTFSTDNLKEAKRFYGQVLGLKIKENKMGLLELDLVSGPVLIYPKPDHKPATYTILNFKVRDLEEQVEQLAGKGLKFEHYDGTVKTDSKGIHTSEKGPSIAWFKDPAGNILSIIEEK